MTPSAYSFYMPATAFEEELQQERRRPRIRRRRPRPVRRSRVRARRPVGRKGRRPIPRPKPRPKRPGRPRPRPRYKWRSRWRTIYLDPHPRPRSYRAVRLNRRYARVLGWNRYLERILALLNLPAGAIINNAFVRAVRRWQRRKGLRITGAIGPDSWQLMRRQLRIDDPRSSGPAVMPLFKNDPKLRRMPLRPANPIGMRRSWPERKKKLARLYNRQGGLIAQLARKVNLPLPVALAAWAYAKSRFAAKAETHYSLLGYRSRRQAQRQFDRGPRQELLSFFDYLMRKSAPRKGDLLVWLRNKKWTQFARHFRGNTAPAGGLLHLLELAKGLPL